MTGTTHIVRFSVVLSLVLVSAQALAWGPRAQRTITGMAIQVIQQKYPDTFRPGESKYGVDVLRGTEAGAPVIAEMLPINSEAEAIQAVGIQIQLLRDLRPFGAGSYFAFRMGALSALISDVLLPYGLAWTPEEKALQQKIQKDIDEHLTEYGYTNRSVKLMPILDVTHHFHAQQAFYGDNRLLIADDYRRGVGYDGFLRESSKSYFSKAVSSVSGAWFTIVRPQPVVTNSPITNTLMEQYFVDEIAYLLGEKSNFYQAGVAYENLASLAPTDPRIFEQVGDHYYAFGTRASIERSVKEWRNAHSLGGPNRDRVAGKLSAHYLKEGRKFLAEAEKKGRGETELPSALGSFQQALRFDRTSEIAAELIQETNRLKKARDERREMIVNIIASAASTREEAENQATGGSYGNAILSYRQALEILAAVDDEFTDQFNEMNQMRQSIARSIGTAISDILEQASGAIEEGENAEELHKWEDAIKAYERVAVIVSAIPNDSNASALEDKKTAIESARAKKDGVDDARRRYERSN
ncbi:MAG: hypothetical protein L3K26_13400, partial [Candidatus Hydrogenedentes bacterium]|nr:hypothetical protein [Candidatus Hydrogenedentota bacterium]